MSGETLPQLDYRAQPNHGQSAGLAQRPVGYDDPLDGVAIAPPDDAGIHVYDLADGRRACSLVQPALAGFSPDLAITLRWERYVP